jgi:dTDP-glucose 4,6-dehydratase
MKVLITGGAGFIGSNFTRLALSPDFPEISSVIVVDKLTYAGRYSNVEPFAVNPNFEFIEGDICEISLMRDLSKNVDAIINFAAESHVDKSISDPAEFVKTNILGTQVLLESARRNKIGRFIQISTDEVYGSVSQGSSLETSPLLPNSPYSASKAAADLLVRSYSVTYGLNTNITRSSNNFGPAQDPEKLIPHFISKLHKGEKVPVYGSGMNIRDWLFVEDNCNGIYQVLMKGSSGEIYNIGGGVEFTNLQITNKLLKLFGFSENHIDFVDDRLGHDFRYSVNWEKVSKLGYSPKANFDLMLEKTFEWYLKNPEMLHSKS